MKNYLSIIFFISLFFSKIKLQKLSDFETKEEIKIMCIGDSITDGFGLEGSYRKFLYNGLVKKGYNNINMIGAKNEGIKTYTDEDAGETFEYDDDNSGYSTFTIKSYTSRSGIYEKLVETNCLSQEPDIVLLLIGTNNIIDNRDSTENSKDLDSLIDYIFQNIPKDSMLFVATIPEMDPNKEEVYSWFSKYRVSSDNKIEYSDEEVHKMFYIISNIIIQILLQKLIPENKQAKIFR